MKETRIRLEDSDHERLRVAAAYAGLSMAEFLKRAGMDAIKQQERKAAAATPDEEGAR
jgi:predicted HicB family RNase H-like nuclease